MDCNGDQPVEVFASFCKDISGPMVNLEKNPDFKTVLENFLLPFLSEIIDNEIPIFAMDSKADAKVVSEWFYFRGFSAIVLPHCNATFDPFDIVWSRLLNLISKFSLSTENQLWETVANAYDDPSFGSVWFSASLPIKIRLKKMYGSSFNALSL